MGLSQVLQRPETSCRLGLPVSGGGVPRDRECPVEGLEGIGKFTGAGAGIVGRNSGTLALIQYDPVQMIGSTSITVEPGILPE